VPTQFITGSLQETRKLRDADGVVQRLLDFRRPYEKLWSQLYRHLVGKPGAIRTYPDGSPRSNIFAQIPFANVNFVRNTVNEALFSVDPPFETLPAGARDEEAARKMQLVLDKLALRDARLRHVFNEFLGGLGTYGMYALDVGWDWDADLVYDEEDQPVTPDETTPPELIGQDPQTGEPLVINPLTGEPLMQRVKVLKPVPRSRPKFTALDIFDIAIDPDGAYVAKFFDKTVPQMERENQIAQAAGMELYNAGALARLREEVFKDGDMEGTRNALVRICELWNAVDGTFDLFTSAADVTALSFKDERYSYRSANYSRYQRSVASVQKTLLATGYNPYAHCKVPILYTHYTKLPGEAVGVGVIEPNFNATEIFSAALSMIMDNWNTGVNQRFFYDATRDIDLGDLQNVNSPKALVGVFGNPNDVMAEIPTRPPDPGSYNILTILKQLIEQAANISDAYQRGGGVTAGNKTASGISAVIQQANKGMSQLVLQICEDILQPLLKMSAANIQQFGSDEIEVRITDEAPSIPKVNSQFLTISKAELAGNFDFRITGAAYMENRFVIQNNSRMLFETVAKTGPEWLKLDTAYEELFKIHRIPYAHRYIRTAEEVELEKQRQMLMAYLQAIAATQQNEADAAAATQEKESGKGKGGGGGATTPKRPMPSVEEISGAVRQFSQRMGGNVQGSSSSMGGQGV